ncbi:MAG: peptidoglycan editing factor PgeF [Methylophilaceae bacterium]
MLNRQDLIIPNWPAPENVKAIQTTRVGGVSLAPYYSLNLGSHVQDNPLHVAQNRQFLSQWMPSEPVWLNQVHGIQVVNAAITHCVPNADASFTTDKNVVCVTMTADCLPVLLCDTQGKVAAAVHAGWRSLCDGVIEATVEAMQVDKPAVMAWLGPAIGPQAFEVGPDVRAQFIAQDVSASLAFQASGDKYLGNLYQIATQRLRRLGITQIYGAGQANEMWCTYNEASRFFSFRRDGDTGRMGTFIWLT